jgi:hypothetical protein
MPPEGCRTEKRDPVGKWAQNLALVLTATGVLFTVCNLCRLPPAIDSNPDQHRLSEKASKAVYGHGRELGVTYESRDELHLVFEYPGPQASPAAYYLQFEARGVDRKDQVDVSLNGVHLAFVAHASADISLPQRIRLPGKYLKSGIENEVVFDETDNPPKAVPWAIAKARLIVRPLPKCSGEECVREAQRLYDGGQLLGDEVWIKGWAVLHRALLFLDSVEPKPELNGKIESELKRLDRVCGRVLMTAKRYEELKEPKKALWEYKNGLAWFPEGEDEHPCRQALRDRIQAFGEPGRE